jgi:phospholipid transport system substrate-binding protein
VRTGGGWRLYDMSVEGVSMIGSFRAQFADILSQDNMSTLLNKLSGHNTRS